MALAALKGNIEDVEALAIQLGANIEDVSTARPLPLDTPQRIASKLSDALNRARQKPTY